MDQSRFTGEDERRLHAMGYAQELRRRLGGFQSFAISFSIICILSGGIASLQVALGTGGPFMATGGWIIGGIFALMVAACLGQIASAFPTAGSLYHWSSLLGGKFWGWLTAYTNLLGLLFVIPAVNVILYGFVRDLLFAGVLGRDVSGWTNFFDPLNTSFTHGLIFVAGVTAVQCALNHLAPRLTIWLTDISGYLIFVITLLLVALLFSHVKSFDLGSAFTFANTTGDAGGGTAPLYGGIIAILMGMLYPLFTITGFDGSAHVAEETTNAQGTVHRGMIHAVFWSLIFGFILALGMVMALPAVYDVLAADPKQTVLSADVMKSLAGIAGGPKPLDMVILGGNAFSALFTTLIVSSVLGKICAIGIVVANFLCALAALTSTSRMIYAFSRDHGLPSILAKVDPRRQTPATAIWCTGLATFLLVVVTAPLNAFNALSTGSAMYLYMSYAMPVAAGMIAEGKSWTQKGPFSLGIWFKIFGMIIVLGIIGVLIGGHAFVPSVQADATATPPVAYAPGLIWYTVIFYVVLVAAWFGFERKRFKGPPMGDEIARRQALIAQQESLRLKVAT